MELTPKAIEEAEFRQTFRGYDVDQVDEFLEQVAAGVASLMKKLDAASAAGGRSATPARRDAPTASPAAKPAPTSIEDNTDELRRTLILAQRTADAAIREAKEEAARLVAEARNSSSRQVAEADAKAKKLVADAEAQAAAIVAEAARMAEQHRTSAHARLLSEVEALEGTREQLRSDANVIDRHVEEQRQQLRGALAELQRLIDDPQGLQLGPPPEERLIEKPQFDPLERIGPAPTAASLTPEPARQDPTPPRSGPADRVEPAEQGSPHGPDGSAGSATSSPIEISLPEPPPPAAVPDSWASMRDDPVEPVVDHTQPPAGAAAAVGQDRYDERGDARPPATDTQPPGLDQRPAPLPPVTAADPAPPDATPPHATPVVGDNNQGDSGGEPTHATPQLVGDADEDAFLAELRKAMTDDEPLGPKQGADLRVRPPATTSDEFPRSRSRFGRRR